MSDAPKEFVMLRIEKTAIALDEAELLELERIETDQDSEAALKFLHNAVYNKVELSQRARCGVKIEKTEGSIPK